MNSKCAKNQEITLLSIHTKDIRQADFLLIHFEY